MKKHDERKNEILDVAEKLFYLKGYEQCTVNDILNEIGIAKGTFYHYFKSKEEVLDAIISRYMIIIADRTEKIIIRDDIEPSEKLMYAFMAMRIEDMVDSNVLNCLHKGENALLHQKILSRVIENMTPVLVNIIKEGIQKGIFSCRYTEQYIQIFLAASLTLTDEGIFESDADFQLKIMTALISVLEMMLCVPQNSFMQMFNKLHFWKTDENVLETE